MLDICLLGTGGMMPMPSRFLTAMLARLNGRLSDGGYAALQRQQSAD